MKNMTQQRIEVLRTQLSIERLRAGPPAPADTDRLKAAGSAYSKDCLNSISGLNGTKRFKPFEQLIF